MDTPGIRALAMTGAGCRYASEWFRQPTRNAAAACTAPPSHPASPPPRPRAAAVAASRRRRRSCSGRERWLAGPQTLARLVSRRPPTARAARDEPRKGEKVSSSSRARSRSTRLARSIAARGDGPRTVCARSAVTRREPLTTSRDSLVRVNRSNDFVTASGAVNLDLNDPLRRDSGSLRAFEVGRARPRVRSGALKEPTFTVTQHGPNAVDNTPPTARVRVTLTRRLSSGARCGGAQRVRSAFGTDESLSHIYHRRTRARRGTTIPRSALDVRVTATHPPSSCARARRGYRGVRGPLPLPRLRPQLGGRGLRDARRGRRGRAAGGAPRELPHGGWRGGVRRPRTDTTGGGGRRSSLRVWRPSSLVRPRPARASSSSSSSAAAAAARLRRRCFPVASWRVVARSRSCFWGSAPSERAVHLSSSRRRGRRRVARIAIGAVGHRKSANGDDPGGLALASSLSTFTLSSSLPPSRRAPRRVEARRGKRGQGGGRGRVRLRQQEEEDVRPEGEEGPEGQEPT